jgi:hypothetical protein
MAEFDAESREGCKRVDDEPTAVAGVMIALIRIWPYLDGTVDADLVTDSLVFSPRMCLTGLSARQGVAEGTASERLLHHSPSLSALQAAVQP